MIGPNIPFILFVRGAEMNMKRSILLISTILGVACQKKTECTKHELTYQNILPRPQIADMASAEMSKQCGGAYNIEDLYEGEKTIKYVYSCGSCK